MEKKSKKRCEELPILHPHAAGIDVGASELFVAVSADRDPQPIPGSTLSGNVATFTWSAGSGATSYLRGVLQRSFVLKPHLLAVAKVLSQIDELGIGEQAGTTLGGWLFAMPKNQGRSAHADTMLWALLGVEQAKTDILGWKAAAESDGHQDLARALADLVEKSRVLPVGQPPKTIVVRGQA